ncbi:hypothetical protein [Rhizobium mongolense]|uniref:Uncharacterized protein n=1 Tax=Rhizobium mongolense TaxID=57676 RepID=A0A7W6WCL8_9HYPH|nr:hypothetical protein [Rhizobium mongolense]MBB4272885.1 hypothetical protein [Rhizobium mongolense]
MSRHVEPKAAQTKTIKIWLFDISANVIESQRTKSGASFCSSESSHPPPSCFKTYLDHHVGESDVPV